jgi:tetratricopeptide (TPR) repeat protein
MNAPRAVALCQCFNGALEFQAGHWNEAIRSLNESIKIYKELGAASGEALAWQRLGVVQTAQGQLSTAMSSFEEGIAAAERATMRAHCLTRLHASMTRNRMLADEIEAADQFLEQGLALGQHHGNCSTCDALLLPVAVSLRTAQGDLVAAEEFCHKLDKAANDYGSRTWVAMAQQARGELAAALGDLEDAIINYVEAHRGFEIAGYDYEAARCLEALANVRNRRDQADDVKMAQQAQREANLIFNRLASSTR